MNVVAKALVNSQYAPFAPTAVYTTPAATITIIDKFTVSNVDSSSQSINIFIVPSGGSADGSTILIQALAIPAGTIRDFTELRNHILNARDGIVVSSSGSNKLVIRVSGREAS